MAAKATKDEKTQLEELLAEKRAEALAKMPALFRETYEAKRLSDKAEKDYEKKKEALEALMKQAGVKRFQETDAEYMSQFGLSELAVKTVQRESSNVDVAAYKLLVTEQEFNDSITISVTTARDKLPERQWGDCITKIAGTPFIQFEVTKETKK